MLPRHWPNIQTFLRVSNAGAESMNSRIQKIKDLARGFRNRERFRMAIYFHLGGLDLYPAPFTPRSQFAHTILGRPKIGHRGNR